VNRPSIAAAAAGALALAAGAVLAGASPASASTWYRDDCTIHARTGRVIVTVDWYKQGLTKTGFVRILSVPQDRAPFLLVADRAGRQRGASGMVRAGQDRWWTIRQPVLVTTRVNVAVKGTAGSVAACATS
jgi:hypothetical protein